jgi:hypothetical protein
LKSEMAIWTKPLARRTLPRVREAVVRGGVEKLR